jgi:apolipoprotein N-acyltransferase
MLAGALAALGRPGIDVPLVFAASVGFLCFVAAQSRWPRAIAAGVGWGLGMFPVLALGTLSWGAVVPVALTAIGCALYALPIAIWARATARGWAPGPLFAATAAFVSLAMHLAGALGYPVLCVATSLVARAPVLLGGVRLVGAEAAEGLLTAGILVAAREWALAQGSGRRGGARRALAWIAATLSGALALSAIARVTAPSPREVVRVGVPQVDADAVYYQSRMTAPALVASFADNMQHLLEGLRDVDLVVLTESFDGRYGLQIPAVRNAWQAYAAARHQAILFTSYVASREGWKSNAAAGFDREGRWVGMHVKVDLAPYGERHLAAGGSYAPLAVLPGVTVGSLICEESVVPWGARAEAESGAGLIAASTSDETFGTSVAVFEHLAIAQLRAIEAGRSIVWASNAGPSALIDRWGALGDPAPFGAPAAARFSAPIFVDRTLYARSAGAWPIVAAIVLAAAWAARARRRGAEGSDPERAAGNAGAPDADADPKAARAEPGRGERLRRKARAVARGAACVVAAASIWLGAPALVAISRGDPATSAQAIADAFAAHAPVGVADPFARFRTSAADSAWGAIGYYLAYYGAEARPLDAARSSQDAPRSIDVVRGALDADLPSHAIALRAETFPRVATLVQLRDGSFAVVTRPNGEGPGQLFFPTLGLTRPLPLVGIFALLAPGPHIGLIAAPVTCDDAGCRASD